MTALPTQHGYTNVTPDELETLIETHKNHKVTVAFIGIDSETDDCLYTVRWRT
jgi:hypothetical protein